MPRKAQYDLDLILSQGIDVFLEHGYHGAIMDEIITRTEFNRRGFYLEFGSKQTFLYMVLKHYQSSQLNKTMAHLETNQGLDSITQFFKHYVQHVKGRGCLLINCITELGFDDEKVREIGRHYLDRLQIDFIGCLEKALLLGQVHSYIDIEATALQLTSYVQGFAVNAVLAGDTDELDLATQALLGPLALKR
ncbi:TetR/AcrR family transcriptional regulator [Paraglaciecola aquimarina]|uniref:TetR/AcrR family transcriptional regulator n=1 Tax=Paraglaciecola aquimarina TaxID=1235557 RepID=A0ABU3STY7_9ALTE|nr:TetR/AcrR family transcriptional regulator [Paraglaciecola aquimarina]MDU0353448.1 TetR/AcrR family transcriptional regulator [Paraglaciecola aquimarina]